MRQDKLIPPMRHRAGAERLVRATGAALDGVAAALAHIMTSASVLVLQRQDSDVPATLALPGGPAIPLAALLLSLALSTSARPAHLVAVGIAVLAGMAIDCLRRA